MTLWSNEGPLLQQCGLMATLITANTCTNMSASVAETPGEGTEHFSEKNSPSVGYPGKHSPLSSDCLPPPETETKCRHQSRGFKLKFHTFCSLLGGVKLLLCRPSKSRGVKQNGSLLPAGDTATKSVWRRIKIMQLALLFLFVCIFI